MHRIASVSLALLVVCAAAAFAAGRELPTVVVVVAATSRIDSIDAGLLRDLFLKRRTRLADGARPVPVNLPVGHPARERFSVAALGRRPSDLAAYWDRMYFEGVRPPIVLPSSEAVRLYLRVNELAIGYLAEEDLDASMRVLLRFPAHADGDRSR